MKKLLAALTALILVSLVLGFLAFKAKEDRDDKRRTESADRDRHLTRASKTCQDAISAKLAPKRVLDFPVEAAFTGITYTTTGFSYGIVADTGTAKYRIKCFMDENYNVIDTILH